MTSLSVWLVFGTLFIHTVHAGFYGYADQNDNLINNGDFEQEISSDDWTLCSASGERVEGGNSGNYSYRIFDRLKPWGSVCQTIDAAEKGLKKNTVYFFSAFIKILSYPHNETYPYVDAKGRSKFLFANGSEEAINSGRMPFIVTEGIWYQLGTDITTPDDDITGIEVFLQVDPVDVEFLVDTWSFVELPHDPDWKTTLTQQAEQIRRENTTVCGTIGSNVELIPGETTVKIDLTRHEFGFGTAIQADPFNNYTTANANYRNFILDNFNWVVFENDMKWNRMEVEKGNITYERVDTAIAELEEYNMTVRGHLLLWSLELRNAEWVKELTGMEMLREIEIRMQYMLEHYNGQIYEWDVNNEFLHGHFFEEQSGNWNILDDQFVLANSLDPAARMCLNDFDLMKTGGMALAQANLAKGLLASGVPVHCVGAQSHLRTLPVAPESLQKRLDILASAGLPIAITELSLHSYNMTVRTEGLEMAFRVYMAHPSVESITIWGFGDQYDPFSDDHYLTEGTDFVPNEAGEKLLELIHTEYHTTEEVVLDGPSFCHDFPAWRGNYRVTVENGGVVEYETDFYVSKNGDNDFNFTTP